MDTLERNGLITITILSIAFFIFAFINKNYAWGVYALLTPFFVYLILRLGKLILDPFSVFGTILALTLHYAGGILQFYSIPYYEFVIVHPISSIVLAYVLFFKINSLHFIRKKSRHLLFLGFVTVSMVVLLGLFNEIFEYVVDFFFVDTYRESLANSLLDQVINTLGGIAGVYMAYMKTNRKAFK
jgi:hypothetical protein